MGEGYFSIAGTPNEFFALVDFDYCLSLLCVFVTYYVSSRPRHTQQWSTKSSQNDFILQFMPCSMCHTAWHTVSHKLHHPTTSVLKTLQYFVWRFMAVLINFVHHYCMWRLVTCFLKVGINPHKMSNSETKYESILYSYFCATEKQCIILLCINNYIPYIPLFCCNPL